MTLPASPESEMALLGSMLVEPRVIPEVSGVVLSGSWFASESHAALYDAICAVYFEHQTLDLVHVVQTLRDKSVLAAVGGEEYIVTLAEQTPSAANWPFYARQVATKHRLRCVQRAAEEIVHACQQNPDAEEVCAAALVSLMRAIESSAPAEDVSAYEAMQKALHEIRERVRTYYPTGLHGLDKLIGGIPSRGLTTVLGVPGSGKSSFAFMLADHAAVELAVPVRVFSYEMSAMTAVVNVLSARARVSLSELRRKLYTPTPPEEERIGEALARYKSADFRFVQQSITAQDIYTRCALYRRKGVRLIVVDYLQSLPHSRAYKSEVESLNESVRVLQRISRDLEIAVVMVSQMTLSEVRQSRPPRASDGKGSGAILDASDMIVGLYRKPRADDESEDEWEARKYDCRVEVLKNKQGPLAEYTARFEAQYTRFVDAEDRYQQEPDDEPAPF